MARRSKMRQHFSSGTLGISGSGEMLTADDKVMLLAMMDGLRIQWLLDPSRDVLRLLETFMRTITTSKD